MRRISSARSPLIRRQLLIAILVTAIHAEVKAQKAVPLEDNLKQHIFSYNEIESFEDTKGIYTIDDIRKPTFSTKFKASPVFTPKNYHYNSTYWFRIKISNWQHSEKNWVLEFYDQTIDSIKFYAPVKNGDVEEFQFGALHPFKQRLFYHKNFTVAIDTGVKGERVYYFSVKSQQPANVMVVLKPISWFIQYGLKEYLFSGVFYGMVLVFCIYNLMMFLAFRQRQYIYYIIYNLSIGLFEMSSNGIAYQYLWPNLPAWNEIAYGCALYLASTCALLFTREFLFLKSKAPVLNKIILYTIGLRTLFFLLCLLVNQQWFIYKFLDAIPLLLAFYSAIFILRKGYSPARFLVAGYSFLLLGFVIRVFKTLATHNLPFGPANFYSLSICFVMEMLFVSFAIADKVRILRKKKDIVQKRMIQEMKANQELKDNLNRELEKQVAERTKELTAKSGVIRQQNEELTLVNQLLKQQAEEIFRMNAILENDNKALQVNIKKVTQARVLSAELDFSEFSKIYPDDATCFKFLADLKWEKEYHCRKCGHAQYFNGHSPYGRRCSKCSYDESVTTNTIFQNAHIPLNKAFYMVYMVYATKGKISSHKLSEMLSIRQSTCWSYSSKVKKLMEERKKEIRNAGEKGWSKLVLE